MRLFELAAVAAAVTLGAGAAHAQATGNTGPGSPVLVGSTDSPELRGPDDSASNLNKARDEASRGRAERSPGRAKAARPEDVKVGSEVRDSKGAVVGRIESVSLSAAVVASAGGKVEVPLESFGKNNKGLLIGITKAEFDAAVAAASKPAN